jgi:hypothetical protein
MRIYRYKIFEGTTLLHDFVPVCDSNDTLGLYDTYGNLGFHPVANAARATSGGVYSGSDSEWIEVDVDRSPGLMIIVR